MVGTLIMSAAFATAKYLHRTPAPPTIPTERKSVAAPLKWQVHPIAAPTSDRLRPIPTLSDASGGSSHAQLMSGQEPVSVQSVEATSRFVAAPVGTRPPLPFHVGEAAGSTSELVEVDDEEVDVNSGAQEFVQHTVQFGETLPQIAMRYTGRREAYMAIYQANLDVLTSPADLSPGIVLKIPVR